MKKIALFCLCSLASMSILAGCSGSADGNVNLGTVTLSEYKGVKINVAAPEVTDEEVDAKIQTALKQNPDLVEVDRAAQDGDTVNIDYTGKKDGETFDGGTARDQDLKLGSGTMIDGFESGLVGAKKGDTKTLDLTFPEDYKEQSLAGKEVVFEVKVNSVKEQQDAQLNDDFVKKVSNDEYQTVDEYKASIRESLLEQKQATAEQQMEEDALQNVVDSSQFKLSRNGLSVRYNQMVKQYTDQAKTYGMTFTQMAQANGMSEPSFKEYIYATVKEAAKRELTVEAIAAKEGLDQLTDEDRELFAQDNGMSKDTLVSMYGQENADEYVLQDKVMRYLAENADNEAENPAAVSERVLETTEAASEESSEAADTTEAASEESSEAAQTTEAASEEGSEAADTTEAASEESSEAAQTIEVSSQAE